MPKLYYTPGTCARASHIALEEAGASYTAERVDFKNSQQTTPQYGATAGCVSIRRADMRRVLRWLDPEHDPLIVMGPRDVIDRM
jgi:hypothetical protein